MTIDEVSSDDVIKLFESTEVGTHTDIQCICGNGHLVLRQGYDKFLGCSCYPKCKQTYKHVVAKTSMRTPHRWIYDVGRVARNVDYDMEHDEYGYVDNSYEDDYFNDPHGWGTPGGIYCADDM